MPGASKEIPDIGMTHRFRRGSKEEMVGLEVVKACRVVTELVVKEVMLDKWLHRGREKVRKEVEETGEWGKIDNFFGGTGDIRKLRVKTGPSKGVRLAVERDLNKPGEETGESGNRHVKGVFHIQDRKCDGFSQLCIIARKEWKTKLRKDSAFPCITVVRSVGGTEEERE